MKAIALAVAVLLAVAVGLLWTNSEPVAAPISHGQGNPHVQESFPTTPSFPTTTPTLVAAVPPKLEPNPEASPGRRQLQEDTLKFLRRFATEAKLTEEQWQRFERDLLDLAAAESAAYIAADRAGDFAGTKQLNRELGLELEGRVADYMRAEQLSVLRRYRPWVLVMRARQMFIPPPPPGV